MRLQDKVNKQVAPQMAKEQNVNRLSLPMINKIVVNSGIGPFRADKNTVELIKNDLIKITGQIPKKTISKKSISGFKVRINDHVGFVVTLRNKKMWDFLEKLINLSIPRIRDFKGLDEKGFDREGNYTFAIREHIIFPEIEQEDVTATWGLAVTIVFENSDIKLNKKFLDMIGMPIKKR